MTTTPSQPQTPNIPPPQYHLQGEPLTPPLQGEPLTPPLQGERQPTGSPLQGELQPEIPLDSQTEQEIHQPSWEHPTPNEVDETIQTARRYPKPNPRFFGHNWVNSVESTPLDHFWSRLAGFPNPDSGTAHIQQPLSLLGRANDPDSPSLANVLHHVDQEERTAWTQAMELELQELANKQTFCMVDRSAAGTNEIIPSTWVFKRKRKPDGSVSRLKARFCVRGDRQHETGQTQQETFAPVVDWGTLRLIFALTVQYDLASQHIDFKNAFVQSSLPAPIYLELPPGGYKSHPSNLGKILEVSKSLYGDRRAPKLWYEHCRKTLTSPAYGFTTHDSLDPCLFLRPDFAIVLYVDDAIVVGSNPAAVEALITQLENDGLDLTREGTLAHYLGVQIDQNESGALTLTQPGLTQRIITALGLDDSRTKTTPAAGPLGKCDNEPPATGNFNYRSILGMMMYLGNTTRPDCSLAIHQCARFGANPRISHEKALKRIGRYLVGTRDKGIVVRKTDNFRVDCYVDASFAGDWGFFDQDDPFCTRSRTGFIITVGATLVLWIARLQTQIALSTMEAEYIALATAMRSLLPIRHLHKLLCATFTVASSQQSSISIVWEDNQAASILATHDPPKLTPRSKHIALKYHWFREHLIPGAIELQYISTDAQKADILTKPLLRARFEHCRRLIMGW